ncbi:MAG: hypothetical protein M1840_006347 [Geoglossum simile]|nr:MAG: hypothetical protein M1840_006347 [Geoglossum simile]
MASTRLRPVTQFPRNANDDGIVNQIDHKRKLDSIYPGDKDQIDSPHTKRKPGTRARTNNSENQTIQDKIEISQPKRSQLFRRPLPLPVNPNGFLSVNNTPAPRDRLQALQITCRLDNPNNYYQGYLSMNLGGPVVFAYRKNATFATVAIRSNVVGSHDSSAICLTQTSHGNIVNLQEAFLYDGSVFGIYERMDVTLAEVKSSVIELEEPHIAAVCHEVLKGISYIETLGLACHLTINNVLLSINGEVKIDVAASMLAVENEASAPDTEALGHLAMQLMEIGTSIQNPQTLVLSNPDEWSHEAQNFLKITAFATSDVLLQVRCNDPPSQLLFLTCMHQSSFLSKSPGPQCLIPHILTAILAADRECSQSSFTKTEIKMENSPDFENWDSLLQTLEDNSIPNPTGESEFPGNVDSTYGLEFDLDRWLEPQENFTISDPQSLLWDAADPPNMGIAENPTPQLQIHDTVEIPESDVSVLLRTLQDQVQELRQYIEELLPWTLEVYRIISDITDRISDIGLARPGFESG